MRVVIDKGVHASIEEFYDTALFLHRALDEETILNKMGRLYEDFHFAYQIYTLPNGEEIVRIHEACHSFIYHE